VQSSIKFFSEILKVSDAADQINVDGRMILEKDFQEILSEAVKSITLPGSRATAIVLTKS
jgi:hypothetical protein